MSADLATLSLPSRSQNPFEAITLRLVKRLLQLKAPAAYPNFPCPDDHMSVADFLRTLAQEFDTTLAELGSEVRGNAVTGIDANQFAGSFSAAIEGNETYAIESQAEALKEYAGARRSGSRGGW